MSGSRQLVYWHGLLKKGHEETPCTVQAWEVIDSEGDPPTYTRHRIIDVPKRLRDGVYDLETHGEKFKVRRAKGFWVTAYLVMRVVDNARAERTATATPAKAAALQKRNCGIVRHASLPCL